MRLEGIEGVSEGAVAGIGKGCAGKPTAGVVMSFGSEMCLIKSIGGGEPHLHPAKTTGSVDPIVAKSVSEAEGMPFPEIAEEEFRPLVGFAFAAAEALSKESCSRVTTENPAMESVARVGCPGESFIGSPADEIQMPGKLSRRTNPSGFENCSTPQRVQVNGLVWLMLQPESQHLKRMKNSFGEWAGMGQ